MLVSHHHIAHARTVNNKEKLHTIKQWIVINRSRMTVCATRCVPCIIHSNVMFEALEPFTVNQIPKTKRKIDNWRGLHRICHDL